MFRSQVSERAARAEGMGELFSTLDDCHQSRDALGLIQSDGPPGVTPVRPRGVCRVLDLVELLMKHAEKLLLLAGTNLDFVRTICAVFWGCDGGGPPVGDGHKRGLGEDAKT